MGVVLARLPYNSARNAGVEEAEADTVVACDVSCLMQIEGDSLYGDAMERTIYNALFAAQSRDGRELRKYTPFEGRREFYQGEKSSDFQRDAYVFCTLPEKRRTNDAFSAG